MNRSRGVIRDSDSMERRASSPGPKGGTPLSPSTSSVLTFSVLLLSTVVLQGSGMPPKILGVKEFSVIGIEARTNNAKEMTNGAVIPDGMVAKKVPVGKYAVISSARGPVQKVVPQAWQQVWGLEDKSQLGGARTYRTDFEVYDQRSRDPQDSQID